MRVLRLKLLNLFDHSPLRGMAFQLDRETLAYEVLVHLVDPDAFDLLDLVLSIVEWTLLLQEHVDWMNELVLGMRHLFKL